LIATWPQLRDFALGLSLPEVTVAHPHGHESLKAFGKLWCHWSPYADGGVFKASREEREMLMQADPHTFFLHPHYANYDYILVRNIDPAWAKARLIARWRDNAPKRFLKDWDARHA
jgi:hypothetical protein